ncbi:MAG: 7-carboxy-7-deazaguanine synthase QueE [Gammaproteobacteria bacterium]|nr:7-carboxy-7-deazaguanine synthase QueE [Gammaproteobacteria bacterium]
MASLAPQPAGAEKASAEPDALRITEIFLSIQGESTTVGLPTVFVRTTGCPLRCQYCDTAYAFSGGERMTLDAILAKVDSHGVRHVTVTGGEPLAQPATLTLMRRLCDAGYQVSLETSGALDIAAVDPRVMQVVDIKTPASKEEARNLWSNLAHLRAGDQLKFVLCDRADYEWSRAKLTGMKLAPGVEVLFSPSFETLPGRTLAEWILADRLGVRMQVQLHKVLWGNEPGR